MSEAERCAFHLEGTALEISDVQHILEEYKNINNQEEKLRLELESIAEALEIRAKQARAMAFDQHISEKLVTKFLDGANTKGKFLQNYMDYLFGRNSVDTTRNRKQKKLMNKLVKYEKFAGVEGKLKTIEADSELESQVFQRVEQIGQLDLSNFKTQESTEKFIRQFSNDNPTDVDRIAFAIAAYNEYTRQFLIHHGVPTKFHSGYVVRRKYNVETWKKHAKREGIEDHKRWFAKEMAKHVDARKSFKRDMTPEELEEKMYDIAKGIDINEAKRQTTLETEFDGTPKFKRQRELVFKSSKDAYEVFQKMTPTGLVSQIVSDSRGIAGEAVKISSLGYDSKRVQKLVANRMGNKFGTENKNVLNIYRELRINQALGEISGENSYVASSISTFGSTLKVYNAAKLLGNTITVAMLDPLDASRQVFYTNGQIMKGLVQWNKNFIGAMKQVGVMNTIRGNTEALNEVSRYLGLVTHYISTESSMRVVRNDLALGSDVVGKKIEKGVSRVMKAFTLLPQQTAFSKTATALLGASTFTDIVKKFKNNKFDFAKLNGFERDTLKEYKITPNELKLLTEVPLYETWGGSILTGKYIRDHLLDPKNKDFEAHIKEVAETLDIEAERIPDAINLLSEKYENFIEDFYTRGTPTPELAARTALVKATGNEFVDLIMGGLTQFKDTPIHQAITLQETYEKVKRVYKVEDKTKFEQLKTIGAPMMAQLAPHILVGSAMYLTLDAVQSFILNKESKIQQMIDGSPEKRKEIMLRVAENTSAVPFLFEAINNSTADYYDQDLLSAFSSPSVELIKDVSKLVHARSIKDPEAFLDFAKKQTPNAWFIQAGKNYFGE